MRKNQVSISVTRFGDQVPTGYPEGAMIVKVYADSNNLYAALSEAYAKTINVMEEWEHVAVRCDISTNADDMISARILNRRYHENNQLEYTKNRIELLKQLLGYIENASDIIDVIKNSTKADVRKNIEERFGYSQSEVQNILRMNLGMMTMEDVESIKKEIKEMEERIM